MMVMERIYGIPVSMAALEKNGTNMKTAGGAAKVFFTCALSGDAFPCGHASGKYFVSHEHPETAIYRH